MNDCPVCGTEHSLTWYPDRIICIAYEADGNDTSCGAVFRLDRDTVRESWMKKLVKSSCKGDSEFPCPQHRKEYSAEDFIQCPSCEALEDKELFFDFEVRESEPDVDNMVEL